MPQVVAIDGLPSSSSNFTRRTSSDTETDVSSLSGFSSERFTSEQRYHPRVERLSSKATAVYSELTVNKLRFDCLIGRENEIEALSKALQSQTRLIWVHGVAGAGKTALVKHCLASNDLVLRGKFDLQQRNEPYSAFAAALLPLHDLLPPEAQDELRQSLGDVEARVLAAVFPSLSNVFLDKDSSQHGTTEESFSLETSKPRFHYAFRVLLRQLQAIFFLDDWQWADDLSMELLEVILTDPENAHLQVVACSRAESSDALSSIRNDIFHRLEANRAIEVATISVDNLTVDQVNELLVELLNVGDVSSTLDLAALIHRKTLGNPFYTVQFLQALVDEGLLYYHLGTTRWRWEPTAVLSEQTTAADNVVDLVKGKLQRLDTIASILPVVASLGSVFQFRTFQIVVDNMASNKSTQVTDTLQLCINEGLIEPCGKDAFRWIHDKIQEAALSLVRGETSKEMHYRTGRLLMERLSEMELDRSIFVVAALLSEGLSMIVVEDDVERILLAKLFLRAASMAMKSSAYLMASKYTATGVKLLPDDHWTKHVQLSLDLYSTAAEAHYCAGSFAKMRTFCDAVLEHRRTILDARRVYNVILGALAAEDHMLQAEQQCLEILSHLDCRFPKRALTFHFITGLVRTNRKLQTMTPHDISSLPQSKDPEKIWVLGLLDKLGTYTYVNQSPLMPLVGMTGLRWTLQYGMSEMSPLMFCTIGIIYTAFLDNFETGKTYADHALLLVDRFKLRAVEARVLFLAHMFLTHWVIPAEMTMKPLLRGYRVGASTGDTESAAWCICTYAETVFRTAVALESANSSFREYSSQLNEWKQYTANFNLRCEWQMVQHLMGLTNDPHVFAGDIVSADEISERLQRNGENTRMMVPRWEMILAFFLDRHEEVVHLVRETKLDKSGYEKSMPGSCLLGPLFFYTALSCMSLFRSTKRRTYKKLGKKIAQKVKRYAAKNDPNAMHQEALLAAELAALDGRKSVAVKNYEVSILLAGRRGFIHDQAVAHERFGDFYFRGKKPDECAYQVQLALRLYGEWGARAKVEHLQTKYAGALALHPESPLLDDSTAS